MEPESGAAAEEWAALKDWAEEAAMAAAASWGLEAAVAAAA
jgi:hypothetical protein